MSSFEDVVEEGGSDEFSDGIDDVSADESEGFYEEQNVHRMWRKASLSEEENDETDEDFGKGEAEKNEAEYEHFEDAISDREMEFRSIQSSLGSPKMPIINYGIPLDTSRYDSDSIEFFIMNCYCVVSAMPTSILDSVETALGFVIRWIPKLKTCFREFLGENIYMKLSNFGYDSLETFLDDEMLSDFFIKERDAYDRAMYKAKPYPVYRNLISYFEERTLVEESRITAEEREKKFRLEETSRKNAIKCLKSRYDFLKMLRDCGGGSHAIDLPYFMQKYEMRKPNLVFGKKFWNEQFLSSSAKKTFAKHFSRDLIAQESESAMITLKFIRSFQGENFEIGTMQNGDRRATSPQEGRRFGD
ncbi:hypothetical protein L596_014174 [Steinernema carpocapsae]|uniref:DUF7515 domain-containing protein n=1 Tax=Steinernema carpocapsae TaxID=34508 RepID=A0A4U5NB00_STECR|nr:hypothetical protein L596_014174 [Steinernema carpocapsae]